MHQRLLSIAVALTAVVLVIVGVRKIWLARERRREERAGAVAGGESTREGSSNHDPLVDPLVGAHLLLRTVSEGSAAMPSVVPTELPLTRAGSVALCEGSEAAWGGVRALFESVPREEHAAITDAVANAALRACIVPESEHACAWALDALDAPATSPDAATREADAAAGRRALAWALLAHCGDDVALPRIDRADAPSTGVVDFLLQRVELGRRPRHLPTLLEAAVERERLRDPANLRYVELAVALGPYDDAAAARILASLHANAPGLFRDRIGASIEHPADDVARAIHHDACARVPLASCREGTLAERALSPSFDLAFEVERAPAARAELIELYASCSRHRTDQGALCLERLASLDRARAVALASTWSPDLLPAPPSVAEPIARSLDALEDLHVGPRIPEGTALSDELLALPSLADLETVLDTIDMPRHRDAGVLAPVRAVDAVARRGHAVRMTHDTEHLPPRYDSVLLRIARLVAPALDAAVFEVREPWPVDETTTGIVRGYLPSEAGRAMTFDIQLDARRDASDFAGVVELVNAMLERRGALERCTLDEASEAVVCGTGAQLTALVDAGVLATD